MSQGADYDARIALLHGTRDALAAYGVSLDDFDALSKDVRLAVDDAEQALLKAIEKAVAEARVSNGN